MDFPRQLQRAGKDEMNRRVGRAAAILGLEILLDRYPRQLPGGQRQLIRQHATAQRFDVHDVRASHQHDDGAPRQRVDMSGGDDSAGAGCQGDHGRKDVGILD